MAAASPCRARRNGERVRARIVQVFERRVTVLSGVLLHAGTPAARRRPQPPKNVKSHHV